MWIDSVNPAHSLAESTARRALDALDLSSSSTSRSPRPHVTPTTCCRRAASSRSPKRRSSTSTSRTTASTCGRRSLDPLPGTLPEPEIYARLIRELGVVDDAAARHAARRPPERGRSQFAVAFFAAVGADPALMTLAPYLLYETPRPDPPDGGARRRRALGRRAHLRDDLPRRRRAAPGSRARARAGREPVRGGPQRAWGRVHRRRLPRHLELRSAPRPAVHGRDPGAARAAARPRATSRGLDDR